MADSPTEKTDAGYAFLSPATPKRTKLLKNGVTLVAYHQSGVIVSENPASPWHQATLFVQGTRVTDGTGAVTREVGLCESTDADGDLTWSVLWRLAGGPGSLQLMAGTGKWQGISGQGEMAGLVRERADGYLMPKWSIGWRIDPEAGAGPLARPPAPVDAAAYPFHDHGLSFHGPHVTDLTRELANGMTLVVSSQSGVLLSDDPGAASPRNHATCYDRGTTIIVGNRNLGDVMLLEDTDPDGDVAWLYHAWWYGQGPGRYKFIGGTGKWEGILGEGVTLGMLRPRADDHYMLKSEMHWRIERGE